MKKPKVLIFSSNRADIGILRPVIEKFFEQKTIQTRLVVTGMMATKNASKALKSLKFKGPIIKLPIPTKSTNTKEVVHSVTAELKVTQKILVREKPDAILLLGDRFEIFAVASAAYIQRVPIIHLHGGEITFGALDEGFRHSISKMAQLHFVAAKPYKQRLLRMGEQPTNIFVSGAPALEQLLKFKFNAALSDQLKNLKKFAIATLHPETLGHLSIKQQTDAMLRALEGYTGTVVCTASNNDLGGEEINKAIKKWVAKNPKQRLFIDSLGSERYWTLLSRAEFMIGNSSSGIMESAAIGIPVINIGDRQLGRIRTENIVDVPYSVPAIKKAIQKVQSSAFLKKAKRAHTPFLSQTGGSPSQIIFKETRRFLSRKPTPFKVFYDGK